jgi:hypothetical protein
MGASDSFSLIAQIDGDDGARIATINKQMHFLAKLLILILNCLASAGIYNFWFMLGVSSNSI